MEGEIGSFHPVKQTTFSPSFSKKKKKKQEVKLLEAGRDQQAYRQTQKTDSGNQP